MSRYGNTDKDYIFDEMENFLRDNSFSELMDVISDLSSYYVKKDYESKVYAENAQLKKELKEIKNKISGLLVDTNGRDKE